MFRTPRILPATAFVAILSSAGCGGSGSSPSAGTPIPVATPLIRPNLVVVLTDDLDVPTTLEMPRLPDLASNHGLSFTRAYAAQSLCAPSRASILTGQYSHNHGVIDNLLPSQGFVAFRRHEARSPALAEERGLPNVADRQISERLRLGRGQRLCAARLGRLARPPVGDRGRPLRRLLDEPQRPGHALRLEPRRLQRGRRDAAGSRLHPCVGGPRGTDLPAACPSVAAHARALPRALRRRIPLLARPARTVLQPGQRHRQALVGAADSAAEPRRHRRDGQPAAFQAAKPARGGGPDRAGAASAG